MKIINKTIGILLLLVCLGFAQTDRWRLAIYQDSEPGIELYRVYNTEAPISTPEIMDSIYHFIEDDSLLEYIHLLDSCDVLNYYRITEVNRTSAVVNMGSDLIKMKV